MNVTALVVSILALAAPATSEALAVPTDTAALGYDAIAAAQWGGEPCGGQVTVSWDHLGPALNAHADWVGIPGYPTTNTACSITFSLDVEWDAAKLCTVDEHERGHLMGHVHDEGVLMNAYYIGPTPECTPAQTAEYTSAQPSVAPKKVRRAARHHRKHMRKRRHYRSRSLELGIQDAGASQEQMNAWGAEIGARWERIITTPGDPTTAQQIRDAHVAGRNVILTIGGNTTRTPHPSVAGTLRWIDQLPQVERYIWTNEADYVGPTPCVYRRRWMQLRRRLGTRLLWGDFSPLSPVTFTVAASKCGWLPSGLDLALHPYQPDDPLAPTAFAAWAEGALGNLGRARRILEHAGISVNWWLTEFGYGSRLGRAGEITDERAAWLWPRAIQRAKQVDAKVLVLYTAQGATWDTRPGEQAWAAIRGSIAP